MILEVSFLFYSHVTAFLNDALCFFLTVFLAIPHLVIVFFLLRMPLRRHLSNVKVTPRFFSFRVAAALSFPGGSSFRRRSIP